MALLAVTVPTPARPAASRIPIVGFSSTTSFMISMKLAVRILLVSRPRGLWAILSSAMNLALTLLIVLWCTPMILAMVGLSTPAQNKSDMQFLLDSQSDFVALKSKTHQQTELTEFNMQEFQIYALACSIQGFLQPNNWPGAPCMYKAGTFVGTLHPNQYIIMNKKLLNLGLCERHSKNIH